VSGGSSPERARAAAGFARPRGQSSAPGRKPVMLELVQFLAWLACAVYATIPFFWLMVHPYAEFWRKLRAPYRAIAPLWVVMWFVFAAVTGRWRHVALYSSSWGWLGAAALFTAGFWIYARSGRHFSLRQLGGLPEIVADHSEQRLVTSGIRSRVRHPVYLGHLCEMLAWSLGSRLTVCYALTALAIAGGAIMIRQEDAELERRFGGEFREYRRRVPAVIPKL